MSTELKNESVAVSDFVKEYSSYGGVKIACNKINFIAAKGCVTGILGPNGAGKSTLLKSICGFLYPTSGTVSVCGFTELSDIRKVTAFVPEFPELDETLTVNEELFYESGMNLDSVKKAVEICSLCDVTSKKIKSLSKGYKQRVSLACAISKNPSVLVLDEFSAGLDPRQTVMMRRQIKNLAENSTVIFSTHSIEEAETLCDVIYILSNGNVAAFGSPKEICTKFKTDSLEDAYIKCTEKMP